MVAARLFIPISTLVLPTKGASRARLGLSDSVFAIENGACANVTDLITPCSVLI